MNTSLKSALHLVAAQVLFVIWAMVVPNFAGGESRAAVTGLAALIAGLLGIVVWKEEVRPHLKPRNLALAVVAGFLGLMAWQMLLTAVQATSWGDDALIFRLLVPAGALAAGLALRREQLQPWTALAVAVITGAGCWYLADGDFPGLLDHDGQGMILGLLATAAMAGFLAVAQTLAGSTSVPYVWCSTLICGGGLLALTGSGNLADFGDFMNAFLHITGAPERLIQAGIASTFGLGLAYWFLISGTAGLKLSTAGTGFAMIIPVTAVISLVFQDKVPADSHTQSAALITAGFSFLVYNSSK